MELASILQGHRVLVIYDDILSAGKGGQLRSLPLLRALGIERFTYNFSWNKYGYKVCDYEHVHLGSSSDLSDLAPPLCQIVDQETEDTSTHDITLRLVSHEPFSPTTPFILVTQANFKLRGVKERKSLAEARGFPILRYQDDLLRRAGLLESLGIDEASLTHEMLDTTGNFAFLKAASRLCSMTGRYARSLIDVLPDDRGLVRDLGLWHMVEQIDEKYLADPLTTTSYMLDCMRPWVEYGYRTQVKQRLLELYQVRKAV